MLLFGSTAIKSIFPEFRKPNDIDYVTDEVELVSRQSNGENRIEVHYLPRIPDRPFTADELYTIKVSHAIYDINWLKHMSDIRFLQLKGCKIIPEFLLELRDFWKNKHNNTKHQRFSFDDKDDIFDDKLGRKIHHDKLHLMFSDELLFTKFCDGYIPNEAKWNLLGEELKRRICIEEAYVVALERWHPLTPFRTAYLYAQKLLITKLHPLFIADWCILNWNSMYTAPEDYYGIYERRSVGKT